MGENQTSERKMSSFKKNYFLFLVLAFELVNAASDEEFGVWMKGPQDDMCLNTNTTMPGQLASYLIASEEQGSCCIGCQNQEVCSVERNTSKIICGYNPSMEKVCMKE